MEGLRVFIRQTRLRVHSVLSLIHIFRVVILFPDGSKDSAGDLLVGIYEAEDRINGYGSIAN